MKLTNEKIDKRRWVSCVLLMLIGAALSFTYVLSVFVNPLIAARGWDADDIIFTFTLAMWVGTPSIIIGGKLTEIFKPRKLIIICGLLYGISIVLSGFTTSVVLFMICQGVFASAFMFFANVAAMQNVGELFPDKRGFAMGLFLAGMTGGAALQAPLAVWITQNYSVSASIIIQGIMYAAITVVCGLFIFNVPKDYQPTGWSNEVIDDNENTAETGIDTNWKDMLKAPSFYMLLVALTLCNIAGAMFISNGAYIAEELLGTTAAKAAWMFTGVNIGCALGSIVYGWISDKIGSIYCLAIVGVLNGIFAIVAATVGINSIAVFAISMIILGSNYGGLTTVQPVIAMNTYGATHFGINYGLLGISAIFVSYIAPKLSVMENISTGIIIAGIIAFAGCISAVLAKKMVNRFVAKYKEANSEE